MISINGFNQRFQPSVSTNVIAVSFLYGGRFYGFTKACIFTVEQPHLFSGINSTAVEVEGVEPFKRSFITDDQNKYLMTLFISFDIINFVKKWWSQLSDISLFVLWKCKLASTP